MLAIAPKIERDRAITVTRAYRTNLNMLALVALWTGAFLVFFDQSLSVLRRRQSLALLRALGVTRGELTVALIGEGTVLGAVGSLLGVAMGVLFAAAILQILSGDLGQTQLRAVRAAVHAPPAPLLFFFAWEPWSLPPAPGCRPAPPRDNRRLAHSKAVTATTA